MRYVDGSIERLTGYEPGEWYAPDFLATHVVAEARPALAAIQRALYSGETFDVPLRLTRPDGGELTLRALGHGLRVSREPPAATGFFLPVADESASAALAEAALVAFSGPLALLGSDGRIAAVNADWHTVEAAAAPRGMPLRVGTDFVSGCRLAAAHGDVSARLTLDALTGLPGTPRAQAVVDDPWPLADGGRQFSLCAERMPSPPGGVALAYRDTTTQRQLDAALRDAREELVGAAPYIAAGELVGSLSHELRQPLTALTLSLSSAAALLARTPPQVAEAAGAVDGARAEQDRLRHTLQSARDLVARHTPRREAVDLVRLCTELLGFVKGEALARRVQVELDAQPDLPRIDADGTQLRLAMLSLLLHRIEAAASSEGKRTIVLGVNASGDDMIDVSVGCCGDGRNGRTALGGEALARAVAELHRGWLWTGDREDGSVVAMRLPVGSPAQGS